jgi:hypothetical protein
MVGRIGQLSQELKPPAEVRDRFSVRALLAGALPCLVPIGNSPHRQASLSIVMGDQLGLRLEGALKMLLNDPSDPGM